MSKLRVEPSPEITFEVMGGKPNACPLRLYNSGAEHTAFKVKTTAPKKYCVRPNAGVIPPGKHVEVHVIPQLTKGSDPTLANDLAGKCKDKFMIQSTAVGSDQLPTPELWAQVPQADLQQTLLRCKYKLTAAGDGVVESIPEAGEGSFSGYQPVKGFDLNELNFNDLDAVKAKLAEANKEINTQMLAQTRKVFELTEENAKLANAAKPTSGRKVGGVAAGAMAESGFSALFVFLCALISFLGGLYTVLMTLPK
ncbi:PapD-like protein [Pavlovales sp. CCMP2436]|nr:PapD-like protein [Pavlovales sp. CCMP2436]